MGKREFKGRLERVYLERHDGHSIGTLYQGPGNPPSGMYTHGGNGTYVDYGDAEYVKVDHKIVAEFSTEVTYYDEGKRVTKRVPKVVRIGNFDRRRTEKQENIFEFVAPVFNNAMDRLAGSEYEFTLEHESGEREWILKDVDKFAIVRAYTFIRVHLDQLTLDNTSQFYDNYVKQLSELYFSDLQNLVRK